MEDQAYVASHFSMKGEQRRNAVEDALKLAPVNISLAPTAGMGEVLDDRYA